MVLIIVAYPVSETWSSLERTNNNLGSLTNLKTFTVKVVPISLKLVGIKGEEVKIIRTGDVSVIILLIAKIIPVIIYPLAFGKTTLQTIPILLVLNAKAASRYSWGT
ncbi:hypothetical protein [Spiroplasma endosymbiont of Poecilobothrus nobilitatus]|uniref:hypothetical protein n=1 Tax=Spiroplasma endosymbiont of Poecilobothrus nobilitatus TaxID=1209220 RepID=UPI00313BCA3D